MKSYSELITIPDFFGRYEYLKTDSVIGEETFGSDRYLDQRFYKSRLWRNLRHHIIARDLGLDLGVDGREIHERILIHHINPITKEDVLYGTDMLTDPENLITTSHNTHNAIHFGDTHLLMDDFAPRQPNDTLLW